MFEKVLLTDEMKRLDQYTCDTKNISSLELMEVAGYHIYRCFLDNHQINKENDRILVIAGLGNNGGDALVVSELLLKDNFKVNIVIIGDLNKLSRETRTVYQRLRENNISILNITSSENLKEFNQLINNSEYIIDGIFGIGLNKDVEGIFFECIKLINQNQAYVFSIDIPSGIYSDNGNIGKIAVNADFTAIIQNYKVGNLLNDAKDYHGKLKLLDIGILQDINSTNRYLLNDNIKQLMIKRKHNSHKYHYGSLLTIGGSIGMTGAPLLSAYSALRAGVGLSTIGIHEKYYPYINHIYPELMIFPFKNISDINKLLDKKDVIAFGPGLGRNDDFNYQLLYHLINTSFPLVIDADGIFYLKKFIHILPQDNNIIITPHLGELALLLDKDVNTIKKKSLETLKSLTNDYGLTVVLKGPTTIIADKDEVYFNYNGNPSMATAGSGDCLTGIISALIGQKLSLLDACKLGVYLHSLAGDLAEKELGNSLIATDIINNLFKIMRSMV